MLMHLSYVTRAKISEKNHTDVSLTETPSDSWIVVTIDWFTISFLLAIYCLDLELLIQFLSTIYCLDMELAVQFLHIIFSYFADVNNEINISGDIRTASGKRHVACINIRHIILLLHGHFSNKSFIQVLLNECTNNICSLSASATVLPSLNLALKWTFTFLNVFTAH